LYIVKNRNSGYMDIQEFQKAPADINGIIAKLNTIAQSKELMLAEADFGTLLCKRCEFKKLCVKTKEDMTVQDEKLLLKAACDYRAGTRLAYDAETLVSSAKEIFKEHSIATNQKQWRFDNLSISMYTGKREQYDKKELLKMFTAGQLLPALKTSEYESLRIDDLNKEQ
jgi:hypothetical protein